MLHVVGCSTGSMAPIGGALALARSISVVGVHPPMPITIFSPRPLIVCYSPAFSCSAAARGPGISPATTPSPTTRQAALWSSRSQLRPKSPGKTPTAIGRPEQTGTGLFFFWQQAEFTRTLTKGSYVMVQGAVRTREFEINGAKHRVAEVRADSIGKLDRTERRTETEGEADSGDA